MFQIAEPVTCRLGLRSLFFHNDQTLVIKMNTLDIDI